MRRRSGIADRPAAQRVHSGWSGAMIVREWVELLREVGANVGPGLEPKSELWVSVEFLPEKHLELLRSVNGVTTYHGAFRLFGIDRREPMLDIIKWNSSDSWKF